MAGNSRMNSWSLFRIMVLPCMFLCAIFKKPIFQWIALIALLAWVVIEVGQHIALRHKKRTRSRKTERKEARAEEPTACDEPVDHSLLLQVNYRITEQLKAMYPSVSWLWLKRPETNSLKAGGTWRIALQNAEPFNYGEVCLKSSGALYITLLQIVPLSDAVRISEPVKDDNDLHESEILERFDVKKWYSTDGEKALCEIVEELNTQGYKKLSITEDGEVVIETKDGQHPFETIQNFPPKSVWSDLCVLVREDDIQASVDGAQLAIAW